MILKRNISGGNSVLYTEECLNTEVQRKNNSFVGRWWCSFSAQSLFVHPRRPWKGTDRKRGPLLLAVLDPRPEALLVAPVAGVRPPGAVLVGLAGQGRCMEGKSDDRAAITYKECQKCVT